MNRAVKFRLKNGKIVTVRRVRKTDYDDVVRFHNKFLNGDGVKFTTQYPGQPKMNKDAFADLYENPNNFFIGAWYNNEMIGEADIQKQRPNHPHFRGMTGVVGILCWINIHLVVWEISFCNFLKNGRMKMVCTDWKPRCVIQISGLWETW